MVNNINEIFNIFSTKILPRQGLGLVLARLCHSNAILEGLSSRSTFLIVLGGHWTKETASV